MKPNNIGIYTLNDIDIKEITTFIHWIFFFRAWRLTGKFEGIEKACDCSACKISWLQTFPEQEREKAEEALKLFKDAQEVLRLFKDEKKININAAYAILPAYSKDEDIIIQKNNEKIIIPTLRQQNPSSDGFCYSLADFIATTDDYVGVFATTIQGGEELAKQYEKENDMYNAILIKTLADRLAEAVAEWLHWKIRTEFWGYETNENLSIEEMLKTRYTGIRPAVGYPSLPDQSIIFELDKVLDFRTIGIELTENGAMYPNASVSGLYFSHPKSKYFMIGKIDDEQLADYASRRGKSIEEMKKWLAFNQ